MKIRSLILPLAACLAIAAAPAKASTVDVTFASPDGARVSLELDTSKFKFSNPNELSFNDVSMVINGTTVTADIAFLSTGLGGGFSVFDIPVAQLSSTAGITGNEIDDGGAVVFSADDKLIDGTFALDNFGKLTIAAAVPEPTTWAMMLLGFAGIGFTAYRKKRTAAQFRMA
jgi:PEP-CTERM motif